MPKIIKLSYQKLEEVFRSSSYIIVAIYCLAEKKKKSVKFIECRLPNAQKFVCFHIPRSFFVPVPESSMVRNIHPINDPTDDIFVKSEGYMRDIKKRLSCDLAMVSSIGICLHTNKNTFHHYVFDAEWEHRKPFMTKEEMKIMELETKVSDLIDRENLLPEISKTKIEKLPGEESDDEYLEGALDDLDQENESVGESTPEYIQGNLEIPEPPSGVVQLEFEDDEDDEDDEFILDDKLDDRNPDKNISEGSDDDAENEEYDPSIHPTLVSDKHAKQDVSNNSSSQEIHSKIKNVSIPDENVSVKAKERIPMNSNSVSPDTKESKSNALQKTERLFVSTSKKNLLTIPNRSDYVNINTLESGIGMIFIAAPINLVYKQLKAFEEDAISLYIALDENETKMFQSKTEMVNSSIDNLKTLFSREISRIKTADTGLKYQLLRLTAVLTDAEIVEKKTKSQPKHKEASMLLETIKEAINDANVALLQNKEQLNTLVTWFEMSLSNITEACNIE